MTIDQLVAMAKRIHDTEGWDLGANSTRDQRNDFWARVVGCAYWGHSTYNPAPDTQWHLKDPDGDGSRPQSDDVAVSMPSRNFWDCIPNAGADGYSFAATPHGVLPLDQFVYTPRKPIDVPTPQPTPTPEPGPTPIPVPPSDAVLRELSELRVLVQSVRDRVEDTLTAVDQARQSLANPPSYTAKVFGQTVQIRPVPK